MASTDLRRVRTVSKIKFTRARKSLSKAISKKLIKKTVESRYDVLRCAWQEIQSAHDDYIVSLPVEDDGDINWIDELSNSFDELEAETDV